MPRATHRRNARFLDTLKELRDEHKQGENWYSIYDRAIYGLKAANKEFAKPNELLEVKGIGQKIVLKLEKRLQNGPGVSTSTPVTAPARPVKRSAAHIDTETSGPAAKRRAVERLPESFQFWYLDVDGKRVRRQVDAETSWAEDGILRLKIMYPDSQASHPITLQLSRPARRGDLWVAEMREDTAEAFLECPGFSTTSEPARDRSNPSDMRQATAARSYASFTQVPSASSSVRGPVVAPFSAHRAASGLAPGEVTVQRLAANPPLGMHQFPKFAPHAFRVGQFSIKLLLDKRERDGKDPKKFGEGLRAKGLSVDYTRTLKLGDAMWIVKNGEDEYVLDVVLERKRVDDLDGSILNGRFHEQKFRMRQSGISLVVYLVEDFKNSAKYRTNEEPRKRINTALSSTQVVDGFMVKETKGLEDSIDYLVNLTQEICRQYTNKDLHVIPSKMIYRRSYLDLQKQIQRDHPGKRFVTSFADYQRLNSKSRSITLGDTWAQMLLSVRGLSAEKAAAVTQRWETPRALWEAFQAAQVEEYEARLREEAEDDGMAAGPAKGKGKKKKSNVPEARLMLQGVGLGITGVRAIGPILSSKIYDLFMTADYE
ncbi:hypothetical protein C8R43DRAFT_1191528 [Mycena crocata]|nr:hypothetical protein C8R43DRAFT_1191528 [Mycena crocata]